MEYPRIEVQLLLLLVTKQFVIFPRRNKTIRRYTLTLPLHLKLSICQGRGTYFPKL